MGVGCAADDAGWSVRRLLGATPRASAVTAGGRNSGTRDPARWNHPSPSDVQVYGVPGIRFRAGRTYEGERCRHHDGRCRGVRGAAEAAEGAHGPQLRFAGPPPEHEHLDPAPLLRGRGGPRSTSPPWSGSPRCAGRRRRNGWSCTAVWLLAVAARQRPRTGETAVRRRPLRPGGCYGGGASRLRGSVPGSEYRRRRRPAAPGPAPVPPSTRPGRPRADAAVPLVTAGQSPGHARPWDAARRRHGRRLGRRLVRTRGTREPLRAAGRARTPARDPLTGRRYGGVRRPTAEGLADPSGAPRPPAAAPLRHPEAGRGSLGSPATTRADAAAHAAAARLSPGPPTPRPGSSAAVTTTSSTSRPARSPRPRPRRTPRPGRRRRARCTAARRSCRSPCRGGRHGRRPGGAARPRGAARRPRPRATPTPWTRAAAARSLPAPST